MRRFVRVLLVSSFFHAAAALGAPVAPLAGVTSAGARGFAHCLGRDGPQGDLVLCGAPRARRPALHQSNRDRRSWTPVARALAAAGVHALTLDLRGFGDSDGPRYATLRRQDVGPGPRALAGRHRRCLEIPRFASRGRWQRIGLAGAGADGVDNSVQTARRHPGEVRSLVLVSGETAFPGMRFLSASPDLPALCVVADDDEYPPTVEAMELLYQALASPAKSSSTTPARRHPGSGSSPSTSGRYRPPVDTGRTSSRDTRSYPPPSSTGS